MTKKSEKSEGGELGNSKEEKLIDVEMTQEQLDEFVKFKEEKKTKEALEAEAKPKEQKMFFMNLTFGHNINGGKFGPGHRVSVPEEWVGLVQEGEENKRQAEIKLHTSSNRMFQLMQGGGPPIEVSPDKVKV